MKNLFSINNTSHINSKIDTTIKIFNENNNMIFNLTRQ